MSIDYLATINKHDRDINITFKSRGHIYTIKHVQNPEGDINFTSVTTFIHTLYEKFDAEKIITNMMKSNWSTNKYYGMTKNEIKQLWKINGEKAAADGNKLHQDIECTYNEMEVKNSSLEYRYFLKFKSDFSKLIPYRTEWLIYHEELRLAGSIDMIFINDKGNLEIYDWKRVRNIDFNSKWNKWFTNDIISHLPNSNYWHYALQLNIYKFILMNKYNMSVDALYLVSLHPDNQSYMRIPVVDLQSEVKELFEERLKIIS